MPIDPKHPGIAIRHARQRAGLSQAALAELADCTTETLSRAERGESVPHTETLQRLAAVLNLSLADLLGGSGTPGNESKKMSPELQALVAELRGLSREDQRAILAVVRLAARGARLNSAASLARPRGRGSKTT